ncbi:hypothetical protein M8818_001542 [Zalaria obscura]|uniref:Uncharacterized protein n=1 Tax=Zalaria obscura TaxID=2024903 RepID=A0ACC3SL56_9PEZI
MRHGSTSIYKGGDLLFLVADENSLRSLCPKPSCNHQKFDFQLSWNTYSGIPRSSQVSLQHQCQRNKRKYHSTCFRGIVLYNARLADRPSGNPRILVHHPNAAGETSSVVAAALFLGYML